MSDAEGHAFFAVDRSTRREVWRTATRPDYAGPTGTPVIDGTSVFVGSNDQAVYAADLASGRVLWMGATPGSVEEVGVCGGRVFANDQGLTVLDRGTGRARTTVRQRPEEFTTGGVAAAGGRAFVTAAAGVYAFGC